MKGCYHQFARLAIRLLVAIYSAQLVGKVVHPYDSPLVKEAEAWLEATK